MKTVAVLMPNVGQKHSAISIQHSGKSKLLIADG